MYQTLARKSLGEFLEKEGIHMTLQDLLAVVEIAWILYQVWDKLQSRKKEVSRLSRADGSSLFED
jgi:predicted nucleotide-binding protein (sugar kinase/HSP70/actin superfamily)